MMTPIRSLVVSLSLSLLLPALVDAAPIEFQHGGLSLSFDAATGAILRVALNEQDIARGRADVPPVRFTVGPADNKVVDSESMKLEPRLVRQHRPSPDTLELTIALGSYELLHRYKLHASPPRLARSLRLTYRGPDTVKLRGTTFRMPGLAATPEGFYRFPMQFPARNHRFADMQSGTQRRGRGNLAPAVAQLSPQRSLLFASYTDETPYVEIAEWTGSFEVRQSVPAAGYLRPNEPQEIGFVSMQIVDADYWGALSALGPWMDSVGLKVPIDRPQWMQDAILYSFHPGGTIGSRFRDLGGFEPATRVLLPTLPDLGVNAIWIMPIEFKSPYWPLDYYRFMDGVGTSEEYKRLVARAHELKLHVLQDLVPHGGAPQAVHNVKNPQFMLRREDGSTLSYWLNDFARPDWRQYVSDVARHYVREYGIDGYRVDACYGSKESNWSPDIPYARASLAGLNGGLLMTGDIRRAVRQVKPDSGAILAETESARHGAVSDSVYDFGFCYNLCPQWLRVDPAQYVIALQDYLEEQKHTEPRGLIRMRHVESHDSLRAALRYGVQGMRAFYALSAWIDGMPLIYHGMEIGSSAELARINRLRRERPELSRGEAFYRAVQCDAPGVFTCLRKLDQRTSVVVINFNLQPVRASLKWPGGSAMLDLAPLQYTLIPRPIDEPVAKPAALVASVPVEKVPNPLHCEGATEWFVDTVEGRLRDRFSGPRVSTTQPALPSSIYWREQGLPVLWQHSTHPLHPTQPRLGYRAADGRWRVYEIEGSNIPPCLRIVERFSSKPGLFILNLNYAKVRVSEMAELPPAADPAQPVEIAGVKLRCVGSLFIVSTKDYEVALHRQAGMIRYLRKGSVTLAEHQDLYGDQEYFTLRESKRVSATSDVESGIRISAEPNGLHIRFHGQLRGDYRFGLKKPPMWYANSYVFTSAPRFRQTWEFRADQGFKDQRAFLAFIVGNVPADRVRFLRADELVAEADLGADSGRRAQTRGKAVPDQVLFLKDGRPFCSLTDLKTPKELSPNLFMQAHKLFVTALDGGVTSMQSGPYEFSATWNIAP